MATYVLPDDDFNDEQRQRYLDAGGPEDHWEIAYHVRQHFPAVFDDAIKHTARTYVLDALHSKPQETTR